MFLDPNKKGIEVWYDNKMRNLVGGVDECVEWILSISLDKYDEDDEWQQETLKYEAWNKVYFKDSEYVQFHRDVFVLDYNGIGRLWADYFDKINLKYKKADIKRVKL